MVHASVRDPWGISGEWKGPRSKRKQLLREGNGKIPITATIRGVKLLIPRKLIDNTYQVFLREEQKMHQFIN